MSCCPGVFQVKKVLSANSEIPVSMASLHDDLDFTTMVTRAAFEEISQHLLEQVTGPIDAALEQAGMTLADIREVEVIGGASRIPKASKQAFCPPCVLYLQLVWFAPDERCGDRYFWLGIVFIWGGIALEDRFRVGARYGVVYSSRSRLCPACLQRMRFEGCLAGCTQTGNSQWIH